MVTVIAQLVVAGTGASVSVWGGPGAVLERSDAGATIEFDCGRGTIDAPIHPDASGNFDLPGKYFHEHAGPIRRNEEAHASDARYSGHIEGDVLTLTVKKGAEQIGVFTLKRGVSPPLRKCR